MRTCWPGPVRYAKSSVALASQCVQITGRNRRTIGNLATVCYVLEVLWELGEQCLGQLLGDDNGKLAELVKGRRVRADAAVEVVEPVDHLVPVLVALLVVYRSVGRASVHVLAYLAVLGALEVTPPQLGDRGVVILQPATSRHQTKPANQIPRARKRTDQPTCRCRDLESRRPSVVCSAAAPALGAAERAPRQSLQRRCLL